MTEHINRLKPQFEQVLFYGYLGYGSMGCQVCPARPEVSREFIDRFIAQPIESIDLARKAMSFLEPSLENKLKFFNGVADYIQALEQVDYSWEVAKNPGKAGHGPNGFINYNDFVFSDPQIESHGFKVNGFEYYRSLANGKIDRVPGMNQSKTTRELVSGEVEVQEQIWTLKKAFHRRGELLGQLFSRALAIFLQGSQDPYAHYLWSRHQAAIRDRYKNFQQRWERGDLPPYPYDKLIGQAGQFGGKIAIPTHLDAKILKKVLPKLPDIPEDPKFIFVANEFKGTYQGLIGRGSIVTLEISQKDSNLFGRYRYTNSPADSWLKLIGKISHGGTFEMTESDGKKETGAFTGKQEPGGLLVGTWHSADKAKTIPFVAEK